MTQEVHSQEPAAHEQLPEELQLLVGENKKISTSMVQIEQEDRTSSLERRSKP